MAFQPFVEAFHQHRADNPNARVQLGLEGRVGELPDPSLEPLSHARIFAGLARAFS